MVFLLYYTTSTIFLIFHSLFLVSAMKTLYNLGLVVEPSGAAAFAALQSNKVPDAEGKRVVVMVTGGNVTMEDLAEHTK